MKLVRNIALTVLVLLSTVSAVAQNRDYPGHKDPELFTRMPGYFLHMQNAVLVKPHDAYVFRVRNGRSIERVTIEGRVSTYKYYYEHPPQAPPPSRLQIIRNYQNAASKLGGKVLLDDTGNGETTILLTRNGHEMWVRVAGMVGPHYELGIVERQAMKQDVVASAEAFSRGLKSAGHVEVPGILFDFNRAELKPESEPAIAEVVKLLQGDPAMRIWVVGHTDSVGSADANLKLSAARAASVISALTSRGIDPKRRAPFGNGPFAPVAANTTDDGRAKNRRVELVAQP